MAQPVCNFDCFNCKYPDCIRDDDELTTNEIKSARVRDLMAKIEAEAAQKADRAAYQRAKQRERYHTDPEYRRRIRERAKAYYQSHKAEMQAYNRAYYDAHKEKRHEQGRIQVAAYRASHREDILAKKRAKYQAKKQNKAPPPVCDTGDGDVEREKTT